MLTWTLRAEKWPLGLVLLASLIGWLLPGIPSGAAAEFTVMSYNICGVCSDETAPMGTPELQTIAQWMRDNQVVLAGFQEVLWDTPAYRDGRDLCTELEDALAGVGWPMQSHRSDYVNLLDGGYTGNVIFSRLPIVEAGEDQLVGIGQANPVIQYVRVEPEIGKTLYFFNTHFNINLGETLHDEQMAETLFFMGQFGGSHIAVADWNFSSQDAYYQELVDAGYAESCKTLHGAKCLTTGVASGVAAPFPKIEQIDMIWANAGLSFLSSWSPDETYSDHWPIYATVELEQDQPPLKEPTVNLLANSDFEDGFTGWNHTPSAEVADGGRYYYGDHSAGVSGPGPMDFSVWQTVQVTPGEEYTADAMGACYDPGSLTPTTGEIAIGIAHGPITGPDDPTIIWGPFRTLYPVVHLPLDHRNVVAQGDEMTVIVRGRETGDAGFQSIRIDYVRLLRIGEPISGSPAVYSWWLLN